MEDKSKLLQKFCTAMEKNRVRLHGAVLVSKKEVVGEIYKFPYTAQTKTRMYSVSKSIVSLAIGRLVYEEKLSLDEKIVDIFSDKFDMGQVHPYLKEQTVRDMLKMTTVYSRSTYTANDKDWLKSYFGAVEPSHPCGTVWYYDSSGSYVLGAIVKHRTGKDYIEYLRPVFDKIGVSEGVYTIEGPDGEGWGSSGFIATTSDLAKIAYLFLQKGEWEGEQLISKDYAMQATSALERNDDGGVYSRFDCGYGYQIWSHPNGAFAFRGLGGQLAIGFKGRDLVFACTADTAGNHTFYDDIFSAVEEIILPEFPVINQEEYFQALPSKVDKNVFDEIANKTFVLDDNGMKIYSIRFEREGKDYRFYYKREKEELHIDFSLDREVQIEFPQKYNGKKLFNIDYEINYKCSVVAEWLTERKLKIVVWAEDFYVGNFSMCFAFRQDGKIGVKMQRNAQFFFDDFTGFAGGKMIK